MARFSATKTPLKPAACSLLPSTTSSDISSTVNSCRWSSPSALASALASANLHTSNAGRHLIITLVPVATSLLACGTMALLSTAGSPKLNYDMFLYS